MRLVQYWSGNARRVGAQVGDSTFDVGYNDMLAFILDGERALEQARRLIERTKPVKVERLDAPITNPGKVFGSGPNYLSHGQEDPEWIPAEEPQWDFIKLASSITGPYDEIVIPPADDIIKRVPGSSAKFAAEHGFAVDYEVEFAVVLGKRAKNVRREDAMEHVFGYTIINDVGSRSIQFHFNQRDLAKNFDTFCPMGPSIVTRDEIPDISQVQIEAWVNGQKRQGALVSDQINLPDVAIEWISSIITLNPGDILSTG
ncbi:MAG: fumarylacetoacetate hydrolase family protein, partial [Actinomycetota bacterium]|nr:fumarylacetoacetate hydrolase family protein [Actinomycetota bacterium]